MTTWLTDDVLSIWPELTEERRGWAERQVEKAEAILRTRFKTLPARIESGDMAPEVVAGVIEDMVDRLIQRTGRGGLNKLAYPEVSMEWDDAGGLGSGSSLYLTTDEFALLAPTAATGAFTIRSTARPVMPEC